MLDVDGRTCVDVDECTQGRKRQEGSIAACSDEALCVNADGGYSCVCTNGGSYSYTEDRCIGGDDTGTNGSGNTDGGPSATLTTAATTTATLPPTAPDDDDSNLVLILVVSGSLLLVACSIAGACCCAAGVHYKFRRPSSYPHHRVASSRGPSRSRSRAGSRPTPLSSTRRRRLASGTTSDDLASSGNRSADAPATRRSGVMAPKPASSPRCYGDIPRSGAQPDGAHVPRSQPTAVPTARSLVQGGGGGGAGVPGHSLRLSASRRAHPSTTLVGSAPASSSTSRFITVPATGERRAQTASELTVRVGDRLTLLEVSAPPPNDLQSRDTWLRGACDGRTGIFPLSLIAYTPEIGARFNVRPPPAAAAHDDDAQSGYSADHFTGGPPPPPSTTGHYSALKAIPAPPAPSRPLPPGPPRNLVAHTPTYTYGTVPPEPGTVRF